DMSDRLIGIALPPSAGFAGSQLQNLGSTRNQGVEASFTARPVDLRRFAWDARFNFSYNKNKLLALDTIRSCLPWNGEVCPAGRVAAEDIPGGASYTPGLQRNRVGYPIGAFFVRYPKRDANGNYVFTGTSPNLTPVYDTAFTFVGP